MVAAIRVIKVFVAMPPHFCLHRLARCLSSCCFILCSFCLLWYVFCFFFLSYFNFCFLFGKFLLRLVSTLFCFDIFVVDVLDIHDVVDVAVLLLLLLMLLFCCCC